MTKPIQQLMHKDMTRKEFLVTLGFGAASIFGLSGLLHLMTGQSLGSLHNGSTTSSRGYGASPYGK